MPHVYKYMPAKLNEMLYSLVKETQGNTNEAEPVLLEFDVYSQECLNKWYKSAMMILEVLHEGEKGFLGIEGNGNIMSIFKLDQGTVKIGYANNWEIFTRCYPPTAKEREQICH